jgi:signal transduction histidine kinase
MSLKTDSGLFRSLKVRLIVRYSLLFGFLAFTTFFMIYKQIDRQMTQKADEELHKLVGLFNMVKYLKKEVDLPDWFMNKTGGLLMNDFSKKEELSSMHALFDRKGNILGKSYGFNLKYDFKKHFDEIKNLKKPFFMNIEFSKGKSYRMMLAQGADGYILMGAKSRKTDVEQLRYFSQLFVIAAIIMFLGGLLIAWFTLGQATAGLNRTRKVADEITCSGDFAREIPLKNEGAEVDGLIISFNKMLAYTATLIEELEQVSNNVAHDLRTPITRLKTLAQTILLKKTTGVSLDDFTAQVLEECDLQSEIIETVLTIAGLESSTFELEKKEFDPALMLEKLSQLYEAAAEHKGVTLLCTLPAKVKRYSGDQRKIERALANILDNAVKYTDSGGTVNLILTEADGLNIEIQDSGQGIDPDDHEKIFKRFYRCDSSRSKPGSGLGLSLADAVVRAHNGVLELQSELDKGSRFCLHLP